jgi:hypothetical protein
MFLRLILVYGTKHGIRLLANRMRHGVLSIRFEIRRRQVSNAHGTRVVRVGRGENKVKRGKRLDLGTTDFGGEGDRSEEVTSHLARTADCSGDIQLRLGVGAVDSMAG